MVFSARLRMSSPLLARAKTAAGLGSHLARSGSSVSSSSSAVPLRTVGRRTTWLVATRLRELGVLVAAAEVPAADNGGELRGGRRTSVAAGTPWRVERDITETACRRSRWFDVYLHCCWRAQLRPGALRQLQCSGSWLLTIDRL